MQLGVVGEYFLIWKGVQLYCLKSMLQTYVWYKYDHIFKFKEQYWRGKAIWEDVKY